jgi:hypothetical protein
MKVNPFKPGEIVGPGMFAGRFPELKALDQGLYQTKNKHPWHFLIHGERGIGKSSLLSVAEWVARGLVPPLDNSVAFNFLTVSISIEPGDQYADVIGKIGRGLSKQLKQNEKLVNALKSIWNFVTRWDVMGFKYKPSEEKDLSQSELLDNLSETFATANDKLGANIDGVSCPH